MADQQTSGLRELAAFVAEHGKAYQFDVTTMIGDKTVSIPLMAVPETVNLQSIKHMLDEYLPEPERIRGTASHKTVASFIAHANIFKGDTTSLFGDRTGRKIIAKLDYHGKDKPSFCTHNSEYEAVYSQQWKMWSEYNRKPLAQSDFAEFIENNAMDLISPPSQVPDGDGDKQINEIAETLGFTIGTPAQIVKIARGIAINEKSKVKQAINTSSGEVQIQYENEHSGSDGQRLDVPSLFIIGIPIFDGDVADKVLVRMRYRLKEGAIMWFYEIYRPDRLIDTAFNALCDNAAKQTALPIFMGKPE